MFVCSPPNDKKSFCSIEGEWNGVMYAKWASGVSSVKKKNGSLLDINVLIGDSGKDCCFKDMTMFHVFNP